MLKAGGNLLLRNPRTFRLGSFFSPFVHGFKENHHKPKTVHLLNSQNFSSESANILQKLKDSFVANDTNKFSGLLEKYSQLANAPSISQHIKLFFTDEFVAKLTPKDTIWIMTSLGKLAQFDKSHDSFFEICSKLLEKPHKNKNGHLSAAEISHFLFTLTNSSMSIKYLPVSLENELTNLTFNRSHMKFSSSELQNTLISLAKLDFPWNRIAHTMQERIMKSIVMHSRTFTMSEISKIIFSLGKIGFTANDSVYNTTFYRMATTAINDRLLTNAVTLQDTSQKVSAQDANDLVDILSGLQLMNTDFAKTPSYLTNALRGFVSSGGLEQLETAQMQRLLLT